MKKLFKFIIKTCFILIVVAIAVFAFSYIFPGKIKSLDKVRLDLQTEFLMFLGDSYLTDFIPLSYGEEEAKHLISYEELVKYVGMLDTGDVFFTESENYLSSQFTPGQWKHSVIYIGTREELGELFGQEEDFYNIVNEYYISGDEVLILDGSKEGILIRNISELSHISEYSYMKSCIGFSMNVSADEKKRFLEFSVEQLGKSYDYDMNTADDSALYCSEFLYKSLLHINICVDRTTDMLARTAVSPTDLVDFINQDGRFTEVFYIQKADGKIIEKEY